jgi:hypothetical protein
MAERGIADIMQKAGGRDDSSDVSLRQNRKFGVFAHHSGCGPLAERTTDSSDFD